MKNFKILKIISTFIIIFQVGLIAIIFISPQTASAQMTLTSPCSWVLQNQCVLAGGEIADFSNCNTSQPSPVHECCCYTNTVIPPNTATPAANTPNTGTAYTPLNFQPQVHIPHSTIFEQSIISVGSYNATSGVMSSSLLAEYIKAIYKYGLIVGGILAAVVLMGGGVLWLISAGNDSKIAQAKELITGSVVGLFILFSSWIILDTINPDLVNMKTLKTQVVKKTTLSLGCCKSNNPGKASTTKQADCDDTKNTFYPNRRANSSGTDCGIGGCCFTSISNSSSPVHTKKCVQSIKSECRSRYSSFSNMTAYFSEGKDCSEVPQCP